MPKSKFAYEFPDTLGNDWVPHRLKGVVRARQIVEHEHFTVDGVDGQAGEFIVVGPDPDHFEIVPEDEFHARYEACQVWG